jgi:hypothetical protein
MPFICRYICVKAANLAEHLFARRDKGGFHAGCAKVDCQYNGSVGHNVILTRGLYTPSTQEKMESNLSRASSITSSVSAMLVYMREPARVIMPQAM